MGLACFFFFFIQVNTLYISKNPGVFGNTLEGGDKSLAKGKVAV